MYPDSGVIGTPTGREEHRKSFDFIGSVSVPIPKENNTIDGSFSKNKKKIVLAYLN